MTIKIEKGVSLPQSRGRKTSNTFGEVMALMEVGDSFVAEGVKISTLQSKVRLAARKAEISITVRPESEIGDAVCKVRVWRVAETKLVAFGE